MLTKEECIAAIIEWKETKSDYSKIKTLISPQSVFNFGRTEMNWLIDNNRYKNLHAYMGIHQNEFTLIIVPLDEFGLEIKLPSYLSTHLKPLAININLLEVDQTTTVQKTVLSQTLRIISYSEKLDISIRNRPIIGEKTAGQEIELWSNYCLDWFYLQCSEAKGAGIFETFTIPFADLGKPNDDVYEVICLFAFKQTPLYLREVPTLIFIALDTKKQNAQLVQVPIDDTFDWSQPCPPFCKSEPNFDLLN